MEDFEELENLFRFFQDEQQIKLLENVAVKIAEKNLSDDEIVDLLFDVDAEITHDILKIMQTKNFLTKEQYNYIDRKLIDIYHDEYLRDRNNGVLEDRLKLKTNKNKRLISRYEILGIYFQNTLETKPLFSDEKVDDELVNHLATTHRQLCVIKTSNAIFRKQQSSLEEILNYVADKVDALNQAL